MDHRLGSKSLPTEAPDGQACKLLIGSGMSNPRQRQPDRAQSPKRAETSWWPKKASRVEGQLMAVSRWRSRAAAMRAQALGGQKVAESNNGAFHTGNGLVAAVSGGRKPS